MTKRVFLIVLDSVGIGELPDAAEYGDEGSNTLRSISASGMFRADNMRKLGLFNIDGVTCGKPYDRPQAAFARLSEKSKGKDTTIGHWEISGIVSDSPLPVFPDGFPDEILDKFSELTGRGILCNKPYSGTQVIADYGDEHVESGKLIVYTSADSVFQVAAHEDLVPPEQLYEYCRIARRLLVGKYGVGRVIARPFIGQSGNYTRTANRHDFSLEPPADTILDTISASGMEVLSVGKIIDIFAEKGITRFVRTENNADGMAKTLALADEDFNGLCFVNLVDFDMTFGHRNNVDGYANAFAEFDEWLASFLAKMRPDDVLMITADHGCDPGTISTDHSREYIPLLIYGDRIKPVDLGTRTSFADIGKTVEQLLGVESDVSGCGFADRIVMPFGASELIERSKEAMQYSYAPYSHFNVGAALASADGQLFTGSNIENVAFSPTNCAERTAFFKAVSEGTTRFSAIGVVGGMERQCTNLTVPCAVCRQVMREFCDDDFTIVLGDDNGRIEKHLLKNMLPASFGPEDLK